MRRTTAFLGAFVILMLTAAAPVTAGGAIGCPLTATPSQGPPGTEFIFSGSGYTPTRLTLRQDGTPPRVIELDLGDADPFEISFVATEEDAGRWTVIASIPGTECAGRTTIRIVLPDTAVDGVTSDDRAPVRMPLVLGFAALGAAFLVAAFSFRRRFSRAA